MKRYSHILGVNLYIYNLYNLYIYIVFIFIVLYCIVLYLCIHIHIVLSLSLTKDMYPEFLKNAYKLTMKCLI